MQCIKEIATQMYYNINWMNTQMRFFIVYFFLTAPCGILYYIYETRLYILLPPKHRNSFRYTMYTFLVCFGILAVIQIALYMIPATFSPSGGYSSAMNGQLQEKIVLLTFEMLISLEIMIATIVSTVAGISQSKTLGQSGTIYLAILMSDAGMFIIVFAVNIYKLGVSVPGVVGWTPASPYATGVAHIVDVIKVTLMIINLVIPAQVVKYANSSNNSKDPNSKAGSKLSTLGVKHLGTSSKNIATSSRAEKNPTASQI
ncbi:hypothetical protein HK100_001717 [Physocladia obscura]|uniref:Uncharacterized protein n=1 Tax=Physocladia obscura TaxID=109957 RepID=A0AAD5SY11_9FUNG|nr:hypothetical protein HK100_001717 [Physocladia obscura]